MAESAVVALVGDPERSLVYDQGYMGAFFDTHRPYRERPKAEIDLRPDDTIGSVLERAAERFNVRYGSGPFLDRIGFIAFHKGDDEGGLERWGDKEVVLLDPLGRARWVGRWQTVRYAVVLRAGDVGVLNGDPRRPYLILNDFEGNGVLPDWPLIVEALRTTWDAANELLAAYGMYRAIKEIAERTKDAPEVVAEHSREWERNGARPDNLAEFLGQKNWATADLAEALGCSAADAELILLAFGYTRSPSGLWRLGGDEAADFLRGNHELAIALAGELSTSSGGRFPPRLRKLFERRVRELAKTGKAPVIDWDEPPVDDPLFRRFWRRVTGRSG